MTWISIWSTKYYSWPMPDFFNIISLFLFIDFGRSELGKLLSLTLSCKYISRDCRVIVIKLRCHLDLKSFRTCYNHRYFLYLDNEKWMRKDGDMYLYSPICVWHNFVVLHRTAAPFGKLIKSCFLGPDLAPCGGH